MPKTNYHRAQTIHYTQRENPKVGTVLKKGRRRLSQKSLDYTVETKKFIHSHPGLIPDLLKVYDELYPKFLVYKGVTNFPIIEVTVGKLHARALPRNDFRAFENRLLMQVEIDGAHFFVKMIKGKDRERYGDYGTLFFRKLLHLKVLGKRYGFDVVEPVAAFERPNLSIFVSKWKNLPRVSDSGEAVMKRWEKIKHGLLDHHFLDMRPGNVFYDKNINRFVVFDFIYVG